MRRSRKVLAFVVVALLVLLILTPLAGWLYLRTSLPATSGTVRVAGLNGPIEIVRDAQGIPYIYAQTDRDAFFALGYVHAQDRLWQLEIQRRIGAGRLSEILGEATLTTDQFLRTLGVYRAAQSGYEALPPEELAALQAYADGVNAYIAEGRTLPPEFIILGVKPEPWQPVDSLVWAKMMAWDLGGEYELDLFRAELAAAVGEERAAQLLPTYPPSGPVILPASSTAREIRAVSAQLSRRFGLGGQNKGSNDWVVAGSRTASGKPLLADDPHLGAQIPSIWYLAGLQGDRIHAVGATLPGLPAVVIGHNEDIAWGVTNLNPDVQDIYVERVNPANPNQYEVNGQWADMTIVPEEIRIKGEDEPLMWAARSTRNGPLISDVTDHRGEALALRWTALDPADTTITAYLGLNYASNWDEFRDALRSYIAPSQNFVYGDTAGNIGYFGPGHIPIRAQGDGSLPVPGWTDEYAWTGWIPFDELPQAYNPAEGFIATANNRVTPDGYPHFITNDWSEPYRAERIVEMLTEKSGLTPEDYERIQGDQQSAQARELLPFLLSVKPQTPEQTKAIEALRSWNGVISPDGPAPLVYEAWHLHLYRALLGDDLGGDLGEVMTTSGMPTLLNSIVQGENAVWCNDVLTPETEDCQAVALVALDEAIEELSELLGDDIDRWRWGDVHKTQFPHTPFSEVPALKGLFHREVETGGDGYTVNPSPYALDEPYNAHWVPSYRQIVDLADLGNSRFMHTTGQSGNMLSGHYDDLLRSWREVKYVPMYWSRESIESAGGASTLTLQRGE